MKYLGSFLKKIMPKQIPKPVGRWSIEKCDVKTNHKVDLSNEDHCGPCGEYTLIKMGFPEKKNEMIESIKK
jgi:hypothetical protein